MILALFILMGLAARLNRDYAYIHLWCDEKDRSKMSKNTRERFQRLMKAMTQIQAYSGGVATCFEKATNLFSWGNFLNIIV